MMEKTAVARSLWKIYDLLDDYFGKLNWWPADTAFEIIVGAVLTQNTAWRNVALAIANMKEAGCLSPEAIDNIECDKLADLIRPSGYYNVKTQRLKNFVRFLIEAYEGSVEVLAADEMAALREKLLKVVGIGEETADSVLLYACQKPIFVVDAYTKRIFSRHGIISETAAYTAVQDLFMSNLPAEVQLFNQYHALIVHTGKNFCAPKRKCQGCPLEGMLPKAINRN